MPLHAIRMANVEKLTIPSVDEDNETTAGTSLWKTNSFFFFNIFIIIYFFGYAGSLVVACELLVVACGI